MKRMMLRILYSSNDAKDASWWGRMGRIYRVGRMGRIARIGGIFW
jgi:hypothetical protein